MCTKIQRQDEARQGKKRQERARSLEIHFIDTRDDSCVLKYRGKMRQDKAKSGKKGQEA